MMSSDVPQTLGPFDSWLLWPVAAVHFSFHLYYLVDAPQLQVKLLSSCMIVVGLFFFHRMRRCRMFREKGVIRVVGIWHTRSCETGDIIRISREYRFPFMRSVMILRSGAPVLLPLLLTPKRRRHFDDLNEFLADSDVRLRDPRRCDLE